MEKYIGKALLSIINQSFHFIEVILVNDNSNDKSKQIIQKIQSKDNRIKIINHYKNLGVYKSRIDAVLNSKGKYILYIDPDDMLLNKDLLNILYNYNLKYNLDMIEFSVYYQENGKSRIYSPKPHYFNHYHNFNKQIISQPELSNIIFYTPNTLNYTYLICRTIWNKIIKRRILIKSINYNEKFFHNLFLIAADDTPINILNFHYANNYSNINLPGYLYNIRKESMSRTGYNNNHDIIVSYNFLLYLKLFYKYIKDFKKDLNFFIYEFTISHKYLFKLKDLNTKYDKIALNFFYMINKTIKIKNNINSKDYKIKKIKNNNILKNFPKLVKKLILYFNKKY